MELYWTCMILCECTYLSLTKWLSCLYVAKGITYSEIYHPKCETTVRQKRQTDAMNMIMSESASR